MESHGLISEVTLKFVRDALNQCRRWRDMGMGFPISVNVSVESLSDTGLADRLEAMTRAEGVSPDALTLEITETVAMANLGPSLETLARCRMKGFDLSIDDYGTGFSSMLQLTRLPISEIKIDQSFVTGAARQNILQALIETSLTMARRLNLKTVVEGVETLDDWRIVSSLGCDIAQGYFIGKPMPGEDLAGWHANWYEFYQGLRFIEQI
jgi:EAL domain-containing protein (putative c-di-GMP-specific phosphodiesterase class I)